MALMFAICRPHPNWIPRNPKLMFQTCQKPSLGFSMGAPPFAGILPHAIRALGDGAEAFAIRKAESARECAVAGLAADVEAARGIKVMALDEDHSQPGQRLAAPAHGGPVSVRAPFAFDLRAEQLVRPPEDGLDLVRGHRLLRHFRLPRHAQDPPSLLPMAGDQLARAGEKGHVVRRARRAGAAAALAQNAVVPDDQCLSLEPGARPAHERDDVDAREAFRGFRRLQLAALPEEDSRPDHAGIVFRRAPHVLRTEET